MAGSISSSANVQATSPPVHPCPAQVLGWVMNRGSLLHPLTLPQFVMVVSMPFIPAEGALCTDGAAGACLLLWCMPACRQGALYATLWHKQGGGVMLEESSRSDRIAC